MSAALSTGSVARELAETAKQRDQAIAKRQLPILGVSEFANLSEEPVRRSAGARPTTGPSAVVDSVLQPLQTAKAGERIAAAVTAARAGATLTQLTAALAAGTTPARVEALPVRHSADAYQALRDRAEQHATRSGQPPRVFLCNLGEIPKHKARASFATGFFGAGGLSVLDNEGFATVPEAVAAFSAAQTDTVIICGSDDQYPDWVPQLSAALRQSGAKHIVLAGRPSDAEKRAIYEQAGVGLFIYMGVDVVALLGQLLDSMGVAA